MNVERFKLIRLYSGMNQRDFADFVGLSTATVAHIELGNRNVTPNVQAKIAAKFELTEDFLTYVKNYRRLS
ncbi:helix-turn-helix domain-containing protein [Neobacillus drentensis]|uniref:helix-turn-helix domain-containing protein n=1 Tax=Neobacillus drentensis TaxID=220684 RepID=UPI002FFFF8A4